MGCQANVWIGVRCQKVTDIEPIIGRKLTPDEAGEDYNELEFDTGLTLSRKNAAGKTITVPVIFQWCRDNEMGISFDKPFGGALGEDFFGFRLNSRYKPGFIDCDEEHGEGDFFELQLDELNSFLKTVQHKYPNAKMYIIHEWY